MWFVLFPYNMFAALSWYAVCRVFNVRGAYPQFCVRGIS